MHSTLLQNVLILTMQAVEREYGKEITGPVVRPLAEAYDALTKIENERRKLQGE